LVFALEDVIARYQKQTGKKVSFIPGSSGKLAAQVKEGAPFDVYLSANVKFVDDVIASGACAADTKALYARGRIVIWTGPDNAPAVPEKIEALADPAFKKIGIANPEHAPYGAAAKQAFAAAGVWDKVEPKLVYGANIKDTMELVKTGNVDAAILALSLTIKEPNAKTTIIPDTLHKPLDQAMVACLRGQNPTGGRDFVTFMRSPDITSVMETYGFAIPK
jgi:molybdate transport system substrate-binding protein